MRTLLSIACHVYGAAVVAYLVYLVRQSPRLAAVGRVLVGSGLAIHGVAMWQLWSAPGTVGLMHGFTSVAFLLAGIFFALDLRFRIPVLGAFTIPLALALLVPGLLVTDPAGALSPELRRPLLPLHITAAVLGVAIFAVAAGVAVAYLVMERQVKAKKFGLLFTRLPPLEFMDRLNQQLLVAGFVALSVTMITGAFFASADPGLFWQWAPKEIATLLAWAVSGGVLNARAFAGWRGKRVAWLTMAGACVLAVSFISSFDPSLGGR